VAASDSGADLKKDSHFARNPSLAEIPKPHRIHHAVGAFHGPTASIDYGGKKTPRMGTLTGITC
jgi:hypothetical protein